MMLGLGDTSPTTTTAIPTFSTGLSLWMTPSAAVTALTAALSSPSVAFGGAALPATMGLLLPPLALVAVLFSMGGKGRR